MSGVRASITTISIVHIRKFLEIKQNIVRSTFFFKIAKRSTHRMTKFDECFSIPSQNARNQAISQIPTIAMPLYNVMNGVKPSFITAPRVLSSTPTSMSVIINIITNVDLIFLDTKNMVMDTSKEIVSIYPRILSLFLQTLVSLTRSFQGDAVV